MRTKVSSKGQIVLPAEIRALDGVEPGQEFEVGRIDRGEYRLVRREPPPNQGLVDWLLRCPEKGFFVPHTARGAGPMTQGYTPRVAPPSTVMQIPVMKAARADTRKQTASAMSSGVAMRPSL